MFMDITKWSQNQGHLAEVIKRGKVVTDRDKVRAHRIWHGATPKREEMLKIFTASNGLVTANDFFGLPAIIVTKKSHIRQPNSG